MTRTPAYGPNPDDGGTMASVQPPEARNPTTDRAQLPDLELLDCDEDRIRFAAHNGPTDWPIDIWVAGRGPKPAWSLEACLTLTQLREIVAWGLAVLESRITIPIPPEQTRPLNAGLCRICHQYLTADEAVTITADDQDGVYHITTHARCADQFVEQNPGAVRGWFGPPDRHQL